MRPCCTTGNHSGGDADRTSLRCCDPGIECAGGTTEDIIKITVWAKDRKTKAFVNKHWLEMFPDPHSRPARHTLVYNELPGNMLIQCDLTAVVE